MKAETKRKIYNIISIIVLFAVFSFCCWAIGPKLLETVKNPDAFREFIGSNFLAGVGAFLAIQILQVFFALIPGEPIEVFAGYAFGALPGLVLCTVGVTVATAIVFLLTRKFGKKFTYILMAEDKLNSFKFMQNEKKLELLIFLLFFIPGTPKDLLTYVAGLTKIDIKKFLILTSVARIPSIISSTLAGDTLQEGNYITTVIIFGVTGVVSIAGIILYNYIKKKKSDNVENQKEL